MNPLKIAGKQKRARLAVRSNRLLYRFIRFYSLYMKIVKLYAYELI
jgi:hypothetical protein